MAGGFVTGCTEGIFPARPISYCPGTKPSFLFTVVFGTVMTAVISSSRQPGPNSGKKKYDKVNPVTRQLKKNCSQVAGRSSQFTNAVFVIIHPGKIRYWKNYAANQFTTSA